MSNLGVVNSVFVITLEQVRNIFDDYEVRGEGKHPVTIGERQVLNVSGKGRLGTAETLKLSVLFLPPAEQAKVDGYTFGLVAKNRTPADRKAYEDRSVGRITARSNEVSFRVYLDQPEDDSVNIPPIAFELMSQGGGRIRPTTQPTDYLVGGRDIIAAAALAQNGQPLIFPLLSGSTPFLTNKMDQFSLIVNVDDVEETLAFQLK